MKSEVADLARKLAKTGFVKEMTGIPDLDLLAQDAALDERVLKHDVERRAIVFKRILGNIERGLESLPDKGSPVKSVDSAIQYVTAFHARNILYEDIKLNEHTMPDFSETEPTREGRSYTADIRHAADRIAVTYLDTVSVAHEYALVKNAVPLDKQFKEEWKDLTSARKEGIMKVYKWSSSEKAEDLISAETVKTLNRGGKNRFLSLETFEELQAMRDAIPAMRNREMRRKKVQAGALWWDFADRISKNLYDRLGSEYNLMLNGLGTDQWHSWDHRPYSEVKPNFSDVTPVNGPTLTRSVLQRLAGNYREVFSGNDYHFREILGSCLVENYASDGLITGPEIQRLKSDTKTFLVEANKVLNACRN